MTMTPSFAANGLERQLAMWTERYTGPIDRRGDADLSDEVQLHTGDLGQAYSETGGPPKSRSVVRGVVGGKLHGFWYAFGTHDGYTLWEAPDNASMAAVALAITGGGALGSLETTVLLTVDETIDALRKAGQIGYRTPGA